jgi:hypothetical protein
MPEKDHETNNKVFNDFFFTFSVLLQPEFEASTVPGSFLIRW